MNSVYQDNYLGLYSADTIISCNKRLSFALGNDTSFYISAFISLYENAKYDNTLIDGYYKVDRDAIYQMVAVTPKKQVGIESTLSGMCIMKKHESEDAFQINASALHSLMCINDETLNTVVEIEMPYEKPTKKRKPSLIIKSLKFPFDGVEDAVKEWLTSPTIKGRVSTEEAQQSIDAFARHSNGRVDVFTDLVGLATMKQWWTSDWVIDAYVKRHKEKAPPIVITHAPHVSVPMSSESF